ncbi:4'-phosphopantetheinyl transferase family protein [Undibacterium sp. TJN19]|uniref:4'-phosphopantetheinyl transferase family protein n=1 Tax=Undibacterium sp. TJN19 TaxID=3413055 RepID=UPI003BF0C83D
MNQYYDSEIDMPASLGAHEAHVWYAWTDRCSTPALLDYYRSLLNVQEQERLSRLAFDHLKTEYLLTRTLCRTSLSRYASIAPQDWSFRTNAYGRPEIETPAAPPDLRFNLSNARSLVACIVTRGCEAGIDVEEVNRKTETLSIAEHVFSAVELSGLKALPQAQQRQRFFDLWTLKESYIKARGMGLSIPLDQFSFVLADPKIDISFASALPDTATEWQFSLHHLSEHHTMATSVRHGKQPELTLHISEVIPQMPALQKRA